jgi:hypothetical protein
MFAKVVLLAAVSTQLHGRVQINYLPQFMLMAEMKVWLEN